MKIALIGPYPHPSGGATVHVMRLSKFLNDSGIDVQVYDYSGQGTCTVPYVKKISNKKLWFLKYFFNPVEDIIHVHIRDWRERFLLVVIAKVKKKKIIFTIHSLREDWSEFSVLKKIIVSFILKNTDYIITAGYNEAEKLKKWGNYEKKISVIPPFISPIIGNVQLPECVDKFVKNHSTIISANSSNMNFYKGQDLYGIDMCVELCSRLSENYDVGFIYCITRVTDPEYLNKLKDKIKSLEIQDKFLFITEKIEFWPILSKSDIFVRPTNTDSYGVSIAEAIFMSVPSIASNVCRRPEGTIEFECRNIDDLYDKVCGVLENYDYHKQRLKEIKVKSCTEEVIKIYKKVANK